MRQDDRREHQRCEWCSRLASWRTHTVPTYGRHPSPSLFAFVAACSLLRFVFVNSVSPFVSVTVDSVVSLLVGAGRTITQIALLARSYSCSDAWLERRDSGLPPSAGRRSPWRSRSRQCRPPIQGAGLARLRRRSGQFEFSPLKQIDKSNVSKLQVAWTYPYGETAVQPDRRSRASSTAKGRNGSLIALDATTGKEIWIHEGLDGMTPARHQLLGEQRRQGPAADLPDRATTSRRSTPRPASRILTFGNDGIVDLREGLGRDPRRRSAASSRTRPGKIFENLLILGSATGEGYLLAARRHPRLRRRHRQAGLDVPHRPASRRVRLRDVAEGRLEVRRRRQHLGRDHRRREARHRLLPDRLADLRLLRRRSHRREPVRRLPARARRAHRQAALALPDRAPRSLGLRQHGRAAAD